MAYDIGTARGVIELDYNGRGVKEAQEDLKGVEGRGARTQESLRKVGNTAGVAGAVVAAGLALAVNSAANFEQRMSAIEAVSGATSKEMDALSDKALQLGADTSFSAGEAASAMEELIKAGLSVDDVLNGAADATVALAAAGEVALPEAATIAANAMNQFGLKAKDMVGVADNIAGAANASAIDVGDFGQSLGQVGAVANLAGVSFEDTATAIALMGNAGIKGSDAGTSLKSMFSRLQPVTKKQGDLFKKLGLITEDGSNKFYDAEGNLKSLSDVSGVLSKSLQGMTKQQKQAALQTLFGSDAIRAAAILANNGSKGFDKMAKSMGKVKAADVAKTRLDNFKGSIEAMMGSLETLGITLGTLLLPPLRKVVDALTQLVNWFTNLSDTQQKVIVGVLAGVAALLLIVAAVAKTIIFVNTFMTALAALRTALAGTWIAALGPIALVIAAIAAVIAIIVLLWKNSETFRNIVLGVWEAIKTAALTVANWFMSSFLPALQAVWNAIVNAVKVAFTFIVTLITTYVNIWKTIITTALNVIRAIWSAVWGTFGPLIKAVFGLIVAILRLAWTIIKGIVIVNIRLIRNAVTAGFNVIKAIIGAVMGFIRGIITAVWGFIGPYVKTVVNGIKAAVQTAWNTVKNITQTVWNALKGIVGGAIDGVMSLVSGIKDRVVGALGGAASWLYDKGKEIIQGLIDGITSMIGKVTDTINSVTDKIAGFLPGSPVREGPLRVLNRGHAGGAIMQMVIDGILSKEEPVRRALTDTVPGWSPQGWKGVRPTDPAPTGSVRSKASSGPRAVRLEGDLELVNGRAYITGIAEDVVDHNDRINERRGRM